ncbi:flagellin N-terminal helical domain-containing protein [Lachnobacterium bovis]|jgi:flagellar hook-associated protein 3 FlgL|uniref:Flagellar hook-associated protein 3 FlgL n=1 Tax=Lachnobacterium bovis DSM 14045 TaxID=1122142 RepID=A0A1H3GI55_9FIRM|nr:flagellar biosynthesis protein FlgL [Lachnobacterium bovis]SDY01969.1 flagellar hook-associated protein 3 FlgL [Lachnobacterium bovis DSM 14045]
MRVTDNMIMNKTKYNINLNKMSVDRLNTQMTTQQKIEKASEDPVIAMRSLRLSTNLSHMEQFVDNNIPDVESWLDVTKTSLLNMNKVLTDIRSKCVAGAHDTLQPEDRNTIWKELTALSEQVYAEGNADYAGRTVFTGYRTNCQLVFTKATQDTTYEITQRFKESDIEHRRYYTKGSEVPNDASTQYSGTISQEHNYDRFRLAYNGVEKDNEPELKLYDSADSTLDVTSNINPQYRYYSSEEEWQRDTGTKSLEDNDIVVIRNTGEMIFGKNISDTIKSNDYIAEITYVKKGFAKGDVRPEYYFDCKDITDSSNPIEYTKEDQQIKYTVAVNTHLTINTQASDVFTTDIARDVEEMIDIINSAIVAHDKYDKIVNMMKQSRYSDEVSQANLKTYLDAASKEVAYADDNLQKTYSQYITNFDEYQQDINLAVTNLGSTQVRLSLIKTRVENQRVTVNELKVKNDDRELSDIILDFYTANNAYQSSLTAAAQVGRQSLLDYL